MRRAVSGVILGALAAASLALSASPPTRTDPLTPPPNRPGRADPSAHALIGATVHVAPGRQIDKATVVIRRGVIESVTPGDAPVPIDAQAWPADGLHVYAGFIEPSVEVDAPMPDRSKPGVHWNVKVTPQRRAADGPGIDAATARSLRGLGFTAAAISPRGGIFRGQGAVVSLAEPESDSSESRPPVYAAGVYHSLALERGGRRAEGADNTRWDGYPGSTMGALALMRQTLADADYEAAAPPAGSPSCLSVLDRANPAPLVFSVDDELDALRAGAITAEFSRPLVLLGSGLEFRRLDAIAALRVPVIVPLNFPRRPSVASIGDAESVDLREMMTWEQAPTNARRLVAAGVSVALTTAKLRDRGQFRDHLRSAIRHGLTDDAALAALTTVPANLLGVSDQLGTVEPGKRANLIVTDGAVFARRTKVRDVWIDGKRHEITPAPTGLEGTYALTIEPGPKTPGALSMVIDRDNAVTIKKVPATPEPAAGAPAQPPAAADAPAGAAPSDPPPAADEAGDAPAERADRPAGRGPRGERAGRGGPGAGPREQTSRARNVVSSPLRISFIFNHEPFGSPGVFTMSGVVEPRSSPKAITGDGRRADGEPFRWSAVRTSDAQETARGLPGRYRVARVGDHAKAAGEPAAEVTIQERSVTVYSPDAPEGRRTAAASDVVIEGDEVSYTLDMTKFGGDGIVKVKARRMPAESPKDPDRLEGLLTMPGGDEMPFVAVRLDDDDDEPRPDVPEKLPGYPFGAYAVESLPPADDVVFEHATIWTCAPGSTGPIIDGSIRIKDGKILWVADHARPGARPVDPTTRVVDARGKHISPGIIDCHSHTGISGGVNEGGQAVTAEVRIGDVTNPDAINWYRQLAGGVTAVNSLHGSANPIGGQNQVNKVRWGARHPRDMHFEGAIPGIKFALGENVKWGNSSSERGAWRYPQTRMGVETLIRDRFLAAREYARSRPLSPSQPFRRDLELEALAEILEGRRLIHCHSYRQDEILMLGRLAQEFGFTIGTFQHILEGYKVAEIVRDTSGGGSGFSDWWAYKVEVQDAIPQAFPIMHEVGAVVSFNSDSDELARRLNVEAGKAIKYSDGRVSPEEALRWVTLNPARQLRVDDRVGSLEAGKDADLVIWSGPPTSSLSRCEATYVDGRGYFSLEQDAAARERNARERQRLIQKLLADDRRTPRAGGADAPGDSGAPGPRAPRRRPTDSGDSDGPRSGGLLSRMLDDSVVARRELFLDMVRRGINPDDARAGECGCEEWR